jgi:hypothetical protein
VYAFFSLSAIFFSGLFFFLSNYVIGMKIDLAEPLMEEEVPVGGRLILTDGSGRNSCRFAVGAATCRKHSHLIRDILEDTEDSAVAVVPVSVNGSLENLRLLSTWLNHVEMLASDNADEKGGGPRLPLPLFAVRLQDVIPDEWSRTFVAEHVCPVPSCSSVAPFPDAPNDRAQLRQAPWMLQAPTKLLELLQLVNFLQVSALEALLVAYAAFYLRWAAREMGGSDASAAAAAAVMFSRQDVAEPVELDAAANWLKSLCRDQPLQEGSAGAR